MLLSWHSALVFYEIYTHTYGGVHAHLRARSGRRIWPAKRAWVPARAPLSLDSLSRLFAITAKFINTEDFIWIYPPRHRSWVCRRDWYTDRDRLGGGDLLDEKRKRCRENTSALYQLSDKRPFNSLQQLLSILSKEPFCQSFILWQIQCH